jgi:hypothetical protein
MAAEINPGICRVSTPPAEIAPRPKKEALTPERVNTLIRPLPLSPSRITYPAQRPIWFDSAHRLMDRLSRYNQENPLSFADTYLIDEMVDYVIARQNWVESLMLLKLLAEFIVCDSKKWFFRVLASLRKLKRDDIDRFFEDIPSDDQAEGPSLSPAGIDLLFRFFETKLDCPEGILSCQNLSDLPGLIRRQFDAGSNQIQGWVIHNDSDDFDHHVVPVFAINQYGKTHVFIFDSLGHTISADENVISASLLSLIDHFQSGDEKNRLVIYSYKIQRQNSEIGCATFSAHDLKNLCERHRHRKSIVDFYASQDPDHMPRLVNEFLRVVPELPVYEIVALPPEMMKVTQSFRQLRAYRESPPILSSTPPRFSRFTCSGSVRERVQDFGALDESVEKVERIAPDGNSLNLYVDQKRLEDIVCLISFYFDGKSFKSSAARNLGPIFNAIAAGNDPAPQ